MKFIKHYTLPLLLFTLCLLTFYAISRAGGGGGHGCGSGGSHGIGHLYGNGSGNGGNFTPLVIIALAVGDLTH